MNPEDRTKGEDVPEGCGPLRFDHLHTPATELAGVASKAARGTAAPSPSSRRARLASVRRRRATTVRLVALLVTIAALVGAGSAAVSADSTSTTSATANSVRAIGGAPDLGPAGGLDLNVGLVDVAAHPDADGYWLVSADGGVFSFGAAQFYGSTGALRSTHRSSASRLRATAPATGSSAPTAASSASAPRRSSVRSAASRLQAPILAIEPTPSGNGYWLIAADGGVFSFGDASFHGSTAALDLPKPIVAAAATPTGAGYWLMSSDGAVFAFGDAEFQGSAIDAAAPPAVEISADGTGYRVARENGAVAAFGVADLGGIPDPAAGAQPVVGLATRSGGGYWLAQGEARPSRCAVAPDISRHPFLVCTRAHESDSAGGYRAVNPSGDIPRCVPVLAVDLGQHGPSRRSPRPRRCRPGRGGARPTRMRSRSTSTSGRARRRGSAAAPVGSRRRRRRRPAVTTDGAPDGAGAPGRSLPWRNVRSEP